MVISLKNSYTIITGGDFAPIPPLPKTEHVIACDKGYEYALRCGIEPELVVGDFDSCSVSPALGVPVERFRAEKDDTDTMLAVRHALDSGAQSINLICALGGRLDHLLGNLQSAVFAAKRGVPVSLRDDDTEIMVLPPCALSIERRSGFSLSLISAVDECTGVCISGVKYPLDNATVTNSFPIGVSNEWRADWAELSFKSGVLMVIMAKL